MRGLRQGDARRVTEGRARPLLKVRRGAGRVATRGGEVIRYRLGRLEGGEPRNNIRAPNWVRADGAVLAVMRP